jgi:hypothetical protein
VPLLLNVLLIHASPRVIAGMNLFLQACCMMDMTEQGLQDDIRGLS